MNDLRTYQSHADRAGMSDSQKKLARIQLPKDLSGQRVLDIGCSEGLFCHWASERGADYVLGIDVRPDNVDYARKHYSAPNVMFEHRHWQSLPDGQFDLILWLSAMHYERDPKSIIDQILARLSPKGLFILECGVLYEPGRTMKPVARHSDVQTYPTIQFLNEVLLHSFASRSITGSYTVDGDPVPRQVFHCMRRLPTVLLVGGPSRSGKTNLVSKGLVASITKKIWVDRLMFDISRGKFHHSRLTQFVRDNYSANLLQLYQAIDDAELTEDFADLLCLLVAPSDEVVAIDGVLTPKTRRALLERLHGVAYTWDVQPALS